MSAAWGVQPGQWVGVTWINASFGSEGRAREQARLTRTKGRGERIREGGRKRERKGGKKWVD